MSALEIRSRTKHASDTKWKSWGVSKNPFPESAVAHSILYDGHIPQEDINAINTWLNAAVDDESSQPARQPLAIKGSIGVGKTHWLKTIEREVLRYQKDEELFSTILVSSHSLTDAGMKSLSLGALMREGIQGTTIIRECLESCRDGRKDFDLPTSTPLRAPLQRIAATKPSSERDNLIDIFESWLLCGPLSRSDIVKLGAFDPLDPEGEWVRALAHFIRVARQLSGFRVWMFLLDQLEDLWRPNVTTPTKRARFLADLRSLVDEGSNGSPISVAMAWNTAVDSAKLRGAPPDVSEQLRKDYAALFSRIYKDRVIEIPFLQPKDALPFADMFILEAKQSEEPSLHQRLAQDLDGLLQEFPEKRMTARAWLGRLRQWADELPTRSNVVSEVKLKRPAKGSKSKYTVLWKLQAPDAILGYLAHGKTAKAIVKVSTPAKQLCVLPIQGSTSWHLARSHLSWSDRS